MTVGLVGYGVSLVLYVLALRGLGAARAGAYFATAPFVGAALAIALLHEPLSTAFCVAAVLMGMASGCTSPSIMSTSTPTSFSSMTTCTVTTATISTYIRSRGTAASRTRTRISTKPSPTDTRISPTCITGTVTEHHSPVLPYPPGS